MLRELLHGLIAQTADASGAAAQGGPLSAWWVPFIPIFLLMYFLIIRPQQQQQKKQTDFLSQIKKGDEVVMQSGFFGKVFEVRPDDLIVELAPNVKVRVLKSAVTGQAPVPQPKAGAETEKKT